LADRLILTNFQGRRFGNFRSDLISQLHGVIGENRGLMAGSRDGDVAEARSEQIRMYARIGVN
jgi:hypothetical protein